MDKEQPSPSKTDDSTEEEIIEDISIAEEFTDSDSEDIPVFLNDDSDFAQKKRQLFDIDDDNFFLGDVDNVLSADNIAKHFKPSDPIKVNEDDVKENIVPSNSDNRPTIVEKSQKNVKALAESHKELSPMCDDFILINDKKVNINSLKKVQSASAVTPKVPHDNVSTFPSLNFPKDKLVSMRNTKSLELHLDSNSSDESVENDNSIDEMIVERYDYNAGSSESDSEHVDKVKKISISDKKPESDLIEEIEEISLEKTVTKMEKINEYLKEPLDDITEEESEAESRMSEAEKTNEAEKISVIEKGHQMRHILVNSLIASKNDESQETRGDLHEKSMKELQDIVIEKDMCLDALNYQLSALARRENFKDVSGRESAKESIREYSIATTASTEYRTINDDFHVKILDIEHELHERAICIEELNMKLNLTMQEREEIQAQSEKLAQEVLELRTKIASIESPKSSDHQTVISMSQMNNFKKSLSEDESAAFSKVWNKFETFHKTEIDQIKQSHDVEIKILNDQIRQEKKETEVEINRLRQLLNNVKSMSPEVDALRQELEAKHQKEMEELRQYFERRCVDMEKQYSEDVFSQHVSRVEDLNSDDSDPETLPDDEQQMPESPKKTPKESPAHRRSIMETSALSSAIDDDEKNLKIEEMKQSHKLKLDELYEHHDEVVKELKLKLKIAEDNFKAQDIQSEKPESVHEQEKDDIISKTTLQIGEHNADIELNSIINEYERRLEEQVALAREDVLHELEVQIQALLSENSREDSHWPAELILLREKFTAKSQLEIAKLKIKHDEEMAKMKIDLDIQRKLKRHAAFDSHRDLDKIITERDNLRELSSSLRFALCELAKYFTHCEDEVNNTLMEEINKCNVSGMSNDELNISTISSSTQNPRRLITFMPDISSLIAIVEDPSLMEFISKNPDENQVSSLFQLNIVDCLERLKSEANNILALSEQICKRNKFDVSIDKLSEKSDSCEEEDGLRKSHCKSLENFDSSSIIEEKTENAALSLPIFLEEVAADEFNTRMHELKHLLVKSEEQRKDLKKELVNVLKKSDSLEQELQETKSQLESLNSPKETFEGFGMQTPNNFKNKSFSLVELQERAKNFLTTSPDSTSIENVLILHQLIEDFCRETDRYIDSEKKDREDLQLQIDGADKQLKATRLFLEDQAVERETERDEFSKEIEQLRIILKDRDKEKASQDNVQKEKLENGNGKSKENLAKHIANLEQQIKDLTAGYAQYNEHKSKYEEDLKASLDKVFVLREIITDLETQIQSKSLNEHVLSQKCSELQNYIEMQSQANDSLKQDVEHLKGDLDSHGYTERIRYLEEQVKLTRPSAEQTLLVDQMTSQLKTIEMLLDRKTKTLEAFHALASTCSTTCSTPSEDVSVRGGHEMESSDISPFRTIKLSTEGSALPFEEVQRILEKLSKHNRIEEATVKKVTDLEMQVNGIKSNYNELQQEKDILQERMSEQLMKISSLQSRLDEQRLRAEELTKESQADLTIRVHDLQNELLTLKETLSAREKQIFNLNNLLEHSKKIIDKQEHELAFSEDNDKSLVEKLEDERKRNISEIQRLKDKIKTEMINKVALPDLMETMLAEKNEEIETLREQLAARDKESNMTQQNTFIKSGTVLGMISEYDEPDMLRRAAESGECYQFQNQLQATSKTFDNQTFSFSNFTQSTQGEILTDKATNNSSSKMEGSLMTTPLQLIPRHINFTLADESSVVSEVSRLKQELEQMTVEKNQLIDSLKDDLKVKADEMSNTEIDLAAKTKLYEDLLIEKKEVERELDDFRVSIMKLSSYETTVKKKDEELSNSLIKVQQLEVQLQSQNNDLENLRTVMADKDHSLQKLTENLEKAQEKCQINEKMLQELEKLKNQVTSYDQTMSEKENLLNKLELDLLKYVKNERELLDKVEQCDKLLDSNQHLESDVDNLKRELSLKSFALEKCKFDLQEIEQQIRQDVMISSDNRQLTVDEIAAKLDKELNYSAELDGNILKAIESEGEMEDRRRPSKYEEKMRKLEEEVEILKKQYSKISGELEEEKKTSDSIQMQDASLIEAIKIRLEAALDNENVLKRMLETERHRTESLATQLTGIQRTKSFDNYLLFNKGSLPESPRRLAKLNEFESEVVTRLESEIKLLSSQNERERDRVVDLQKVLDRERDRFNKALADTNEYSEHMKREIKRLQHDKEQLEMELDQVHDLKMKYFDLEREKDKLLETIRILRNDIDKGSRRETKLAEALLKESSDSGESVQSEQFMQKLKEINKSLSDNVRENHQMAETLHILTEERRALQHRIAELESNSNLVQYQHYNQQDLEERANHLFAKYMRSESFRKALVYQKRFLLITIATTSGIAPGKVSLPLLFKTSSDPKKRKSFRTIALMVIAIERMKYITRRWTGKRMAAKAIFTCGPKRSQSASNNNWSTFAARTENFQMITSPPSRERPGFQLPSQSNYMPSPLTRIFSLPENVDRKRTDGLRRLFTTDENN